MNKKTSYAIKGAIIFFIIGGVIEYIRQYVNRDQRIPFEADWWEIFRKALLGALIGLGGGLALGAYRDHEINTQYGGVMALFLLKMDDEHKVDGASYHIQRKIDKLIGLLKGKFDGCLEGDPYIGGSIEKGVATVFSDYDLNLHFTANAGTLEGIYNNILNYFNNIYSDNGLKKVRAQGKSVGLFFEIDGEEVRIDIVPKRAQKGSQAMSMYVNPEFSASSKSWIKTDPLLQSSVIPESQSFQRVVRLLKVWSQHNDIKIGSTYLMYLVSEAFREYSYKIHGKIDDQLITVLKYIGQNLNGKRIIDPSNSSNVISDSLRDSEKEELVAKIDSMLGDIESMPQHIVTYFPSLYS